MASQWLVLSVTSPSEELTPLLAEGLVALTGNAVLEEGDRLTTSLEADPQDRDAIVTRARHTLSAIAGAQIDLDTSWRDAEDWTERWRSGLAPRRVGDRLIVTPSWCKPDARSNEIVLVIDPEMAFGTGEHASTRGALRLLEHVVTPGADVLDVGTGSGILAIAAALLGAGRVDAPELDADSLPYALSNVERHGVAERVHLEQAAVDEAYLRARASAYDLITANVLSGVLRPLLHDLRDALRPAGTLIIGGILEEEAAAMTDAAGDAGLTVCVEDREDGWWTALLVRQPS